MFFGQHPNEWMLFFKICFLLQLQLAIMQSKTSINPFNQVNIESTLLSFFMTYLYVYVTKTDINLQYLFDLPNMGHH